MTRRAVALALVLAAWAAPGCGLRSARLPEDPAARYDAIAASAWGPEKPETLAQYLECRKAIAPFYEQHADGIQQLSLREASTGTMFGPAMLSIGTMRRKLEEEVTRRGLTFDDYQRLTMLVYGRWLRATRPGPTPEESVVRTLKEIEVALTRRIALAAASGDPEQATRALEARLASVRYQVKYLEPFATMDKEATLAAIDPATRTWLEQHRREIEAADWLFYDTAPPPLSDPKKKAA